MRLSAPSHGIRLVTCVEALSVAELGLCNEVG
jgi:hypothetical protein